MIAITVEMDKGLTVMKISGHAEEAQGNAGLACAAVSAVVQTAVLGLQAIAATNPEHLKVIITDKEAKRAKLN